MSATPVPRRQSPLGTVPRDAAARTAIDRLTATLPDGQRKPTHPTFNSAV